MTEWIDPSPVRADPHGERVTTGPVALLFLVSFVLYQLYRMTFAPWVGLTLHIIFDVFMIWLVWRDDEEHRKRTRTSRQPG